MNLRAAKYTTTLGSNTDSSGADVRGSGALVIDSSNNNNNHLYLRRPQWWSSLWAHRQAASRRRLEGVNEKQRLPWQLDQLSQPPLPKLTTSTDPLSVITTTTTTTNNANRLAGQQVKALEHSINNLVATSCSTKAPPSPESALRLAREAVEQLAKLRLLLNQLQSNPRQVPGNRCTQPLTSRLYFRDLTLMVNSNFAAQLAAAGQRREAIELYTQLCKLATGASNGQVGGFQVNMTEKQQAGAGGATGRSAGLLYRYGLNIGNLYRELGEHQQALKYYRLTLDRLSSLSVDYQSLQVRLMNNIVCCQLDQLATAALEHDSSTLRAEAINSLHNLLAENLANRGPSIDTSTYQPAQVYNSRHHLYALTLVILLSENGADASSMTSIWERHLLSMPISHHYTRVSPFPQSTISTNQSPIDKLNILPGDGATSILAHSSLADEQVETRDQLELLIGEKQQEIDWAILTCSQLILEQPNNSSDANKLFEQCLRSLNTSKMYKSLAIDVKMNYIGELMSRQLNKKSLEMLADLSQEEERQEELSITSLAATNLILLHLLLRAGSKERAAEYGCYALQNNRFSSQTLINLANYYMQADDLNQARVLYRRALLLDGQSYQANYNLLLLTRKFLSNNSAGGHLLENKKDQLVPAELKTYLATEMKRLTYLSSRGMILSIVQMASSFTSLQLTTADRQQSAESILRQLLASLNWPAPEIYLLLASQTTTTTPTTVHYQQAVTLLQQAHKEHPYHLQLLERLVALHVQGFNYNAAKPLLISCIQNQPDQVKWYRLLAECYKRAADYPSAISIYKTSIDAFPRDTSCLKALINLTTELGMMEERNLYEKKLTKALELNEMLPEQLAKISDTVM